MVKVRLEKFIELDLLLTGIQHGFRRNKSCEDCITLINSEIYRGFLYGSLVGSLFLNIKTISDNVNPFILFNIINSLKIPLGYKMFIKTLLEYRIVNIYESGIFQGTRILHISLPQGSIFSPLLFNLYVKDILKYISTIVKLFNLQMMWLFDILIDHW